VGISTKANAAWQSDSMGVLTMSFPVRQAEVTPQKPSGEEAYRANLIEQTDLLSGC